MWKLKKKKKRCKWTYLQNRLQLTYLQNNEPYFISMTMKTIVTDIGNKFIVTNEGSRKGINWEIGTDIHTLLI